jgi:hypothetical protein
LLNALAESGKIALVRMKRPPEAEGADVYRRSPGLSDARASSTLEKERHDDGREAITTA